jgi:hypothetical protein
MQNQIELPQRHLKLIDCNPRHRPERQCIVDEFAFILPEVEIILSKTVDYWDFECTAMGLTSWQRNEAWRLVNQHKDDPRFTKLIGLIARRQGIYNVMEYVLSQERRFVLAMLLEHYPTAGRKLMRSLQRKDGPCCTVRRRKRKA